MQIVIKNIKALTPTGWEQLAQVEIKNGKITALHATAQPDETLKQNDKVIDGKNGYLLAGIVDVHGDAFERYITPRAGTEFPLDLAISANDGGLISNGITSFFYSITDGFEPGPRSRETVRSLLNAIETLRPRLRCNSYIHIRHETANIGDHEELLEWLQTKRIDLLSLNDHLPDLDNEKQVNRYLAGFKRRVSATEAEAMALLHDLQAHKPEGEEQVKELVALAHEMKIRLASHDDASEEELAISNERGVAISEFPASVEIAEGARAHNCSVVMGSPNLIRGGSHVGAMSVEEAVKAGVLDVLCSDYHYPSLFRAPFLLEQKGLMPFTEAWKFVSENPSNASGLGEQKGKIAEGYDADLLLLDQLDGSPSSIWSVIVGGQIALERPMPQVTREAEECMV